MAIVMVAMLAFGGTYAYFTATANSKTGTVTAGTIKLNPNSIATISTKAVSGMNLLGDGSKVTVGLNAETNVDTWVFAIFTVSDIAGGTKVTADTNADSKLDENDLTAEGQYILDYQVDTSAGKWTKVEDGVYAFKVTATVSGDSVTLTEIPDVCSSIMFYGRTNSAVAENGQYTGGTLMGATIDITISSKAIQAHGFESDATAAYNAVKGIA